MAQKPGSKIKKPKKKKGEKRPPAKSEQDWKDQEDAEEAPVKPGQDPVSEEVGQKIFIANASQANWKDERNRIKYFVTRFYIHANQIVDWPRTKAEQDMKTKFFKSIGVHYCPIAPGEEYTAEELRAKLRDSRKK